MSNIGTGYNQYYQGRVEDVVIYRCRYCGRTVQQPVVAIYAVNTLCDCQFPDSVNEMEEYIPKGRREEKEKS